MDDIFHLNPKISTALFALIGYILIDDLTSQEQNALGNWLMLAAQVLVTNATSQDLIQSKAINDTSNINSKINKQKYNPTVYDIEYMKSILRQTDPRHIGRIIEILEKKVKDIEDTLKNL